MKTKTVFAAVLVGVLASTTTSLVAQGGTNAVEAAKPAESSERPLYRPWTVGLEAGTSGFIGVFTSWRFSDHMGVGLGTDWTELSWNRVGIAGIKYNATLRLLSEPLTFNIYPWNEHSFYVGVGLLFNQNELTGTATDEDGVIIIDGQSFPSPVVGTVRMSVKHQLVNPYLRLGGNLFYFDQAHRWAVSGELGVAYTGDAKVSLTRSGASDSAIDDALNAAADRLQRHVNQIQLYPVVKLALTYSF